MRLSTLNTPLTRKVAGALVLSAAGYAALALHEGIEYKVYLDIAGVPTACMGSTYGLDGRRLTRADVGRVFTQTECAAIDRRNIAVAEEAVLRNVTVLLTNDQFDALVDWTFNLGESALASSTMLKRINAGECWRAADSMDDWDKAVVNGKLRPVTGLTARRKDNRDLFEKGCV